ncbi:MAG: glycosyltransferase [Polyangiales bacterium]
MTESEPQPFALFCTNFLPYSQTFVYEELRNHRRYEAEVFTWRRQNADRFPYPKVHEANLLYGGTLMSGSFARRFARRDFTLVHAHFGPGAIYALPYAQMAKLPLVVTFHGYDVPLLWNIRRFSPEYWPYAALSKRLLARMTLGLCASTELYELLVDFGVPAEKLRIHRLGIDIDRFAPGPRRADGFQVAMVGRFVEKKGFSYGMRAFAKLAADVPDARLVIVGDGELGERLTKLASDLGIAERVRFTGPIPSDDVKTLLQESHVLLAPSVVDRIGDRESGLIVAKEASACATPVVATVHGGLPDIVEHGVTGLLAPERDVESLATHLRALHDDRALWKRLGRAAVEKTRREYDNRERVAALEDLYDEARERFTLG